MLMQDQTSFSAERERLQAQLQQYAGRTMKRFLTLDTQAYHGGALPARQKELMGLVASLVLRCDDCINYHMGQCRALGVTTDELMETFEVGIIVGGSITIPHIRRALDYWLEQGSGAKGAPQTGG
jgi:AhpD family alkylhydroperoxidase